MVNDTGDRILLIDPEEATRAHISEFLSRLGFRVTAVDIPSAALEHLAEEPYVTVLMDMTGREAEGISFHEDLAHRSPNVPMIAMSAAPTVRSVIASLRQGVFDYVIKPYEIQDLAAIVPRAVERYRASVRIGTPADDGPAVTCD